MIGVLIVEDHIIVREGIKQTLQTTGNIRVLGEAKDGIEAIHEIHKDDYDIVILDISLPGRSGFDTLKQIKAIKPDLPVLIFSMHAEDQYAIRTLKAGASGYVTKDSNPDEIIKAIYRIMKGRVYICETISEILAESISNPRIPSYEILSDRELDVMIQIAHGKPLKQIAEQLSLSAKTISTYRSRILKKLQLQSNAAIAMYVAKHKLL